MYRHALPPGFVLKSEKKALDDAAKANTISLEEFLEVEVIRSTQLNDTMTHITPATQTWIKSYACDARVVCAMEEDATR